MTRKELTASSPDTPLFHIVLLSPEIPNNTGNIGRTAAATGCRLHIIHPIGFDMSEKARRRAGLDYWHLVDCVEHASWEAFVEAEGIKGPRHQGIEASTQQEGEVERAMARSHAPSIPRSLGPSTPSLWLYTTKSDRPHWEATFRRGDYLLFGRETAGVPEHVHDWVARACGEDHRITLPMVNVPGARSLNLATAVCAAVYEGMRQVRPTRPA